MDKLSLKRDDLTIADLVSEVAALRREVEDMKEQIYRINKEHGYIDPGFKALK